MTREYKQITVLIGTYSTLDFKKAIVYAKTTGATKLVFCWSPKARTSSAEFEARIIKVLKTLTTWDFTSHMLDSNHLEVMITNA